MASKSWCGKEGDIATYSLFIGALPSKHAIHAGIGLCVATGAEA